MTILEQHRLLLLNGDFLDCGRPEVCAPCFEMVRFVVPSGAYTGNLKVFLDDSQRKVEEGDEWKPEEFWSSPSSYAGPPITAVIVFVNNGRFDFSQPSFKPRRVLWPEIKALGLRSPNTQEQVLVVGYLLELIKGLGEASKSRCGSLLRSRNLVYVDHTDPDCTHGNDSEDADAQVSPRYCILPHMTRIVRADKCPFIASGYCGYLFVRK